MAKPKYEMIGRMGSKSMATRTAGAYRRKGYFVKVVVIRVAPIYEIWVRHKKIS